MLICCGAGSFAVAALQRTIRPRQGVHAASGRIAPCALPQQNFRRLATKSMKYPG